MHHRLRLLLNLRLGLSMAALSVLAACGGGGGPSVGDDPGVPATCSAADRKQWLRDYFQGTPSLHPQYFWYRLSPNPAPGAYADEQAYFDALTYTGTVAPFPADRWSNFESTVDFNRFFGDGQTQGYGVSLAGLEVQDNPSAPLYVRIVDPGSPAATSASVARGDQLLSLTTQDGTTYTSAQLIAQIAASNFTALSPTSAGQRVTLTLRKPAGNTVTVALTSAVYPLTPVSGAGVVTNTSGRRIGYLFVRNMVDQARTPLANAFATLKAGGAQDLVLDLRYNGGGVIDIGRLLASYIGGARDNGRAYAKLLFNDTQQHLNTDYLFQSQASSLDLNRVYVLAGERTCSAAEQVINGLRGIGMPVTVVGSATCGKPVGFVPQTDGCGTTWSVVNFESVNDANEGRYFDGLAANCPVAENFQAAIGGSDDPLFNAARLMADGSACAVADAAVTVQSARRNADGSPRVRARPGADGERAGMLPR